MKSPYCGRFAPTPSGPLHLGSLLAALGSWLEARSHGGRWQLRIDDLDAPRCPPGTDRTILAQLRAHGLDWDGEVYYQSAHLPEYEAALASLARRRLVYQCSCTRARLARESLPGPDGPVYDGHCRNQPPAETGRLSVRVQTGEQQLCVEDPLRGKLCRDTASEVGDFVVRRNDGQFGYQLACAVDEQAMRITHVVRGSDLLGSTFRQVLVMRLLGLPEPGYLHLPVLTAADGEKLSKQNHAAPLRDDEAASNLRRCLGWLGHEDRAPPGARPETILAGALESWNRSRIPRSAQIPVK